MKIIQYCQHVLGIGHLFRSLEISRALAGHEVILVTGGEPVETPLADHVREVRLPGLMMDSEFSRLFPVEPGRSLEAVQAQRKQQLLELFRVERPDVFLVELYPFGRKAFRFELDPVLDAIRSGELPPCRVVCSLRDILVEKSDPASYESRVIDRLNRYFDRLLIHADPRVMTLGETFSRMGDIRIPVNYTGYVTPRPEPGSRPKLRRRLGLSSGDRLVVASAGGGNVGGPLLQAVLMAWPEVGSRPADQLHVFTGPFLSQPEFDGLKRLAGEGVTIARFTPDFPSYLAAADLSVSMAGYNTSMNILAARVPAMLWPFAQNREQRLRAERLGRLAGLTVLDDRDIAPEPMAHHLAQALANGQRLPDAVDLDGAVQTARLLESLRRGDEHPGAMAFL